MENWRDKYTYVDNFIKGRAVVRLGDKWGHVNKSGKVTTPIIYTYVGYFHEGHAWVRLDDKEGDVNKLGKVTWNKAATPQEGER